MKFKPKPEKGRVFTMEPFYDLDNGYIKPENMLVSQEDAQAVYAAMALINKFFEDAEARGHIEIG